MNTIPKCILSSLACVVTFAPQFAVAAPFAAIMCEKQATNEHYVLAINGGKYSVAHYGGSRNTYLADYQVMSLTPDGNGWSATLSKVTDQSTWKDMPETIGLRHSSAEGALSSPVYTLTGIGYGEIGFLQSDCKIIGAAAFQEPGMEILTLR